MQEHIDRLKWAITHIFDFKTNTPYKPDKSRNGLEDLPHALVNVPVEYVRANAQWSTKVGIFLILFFLALVLWGGK